ncbi:hypothetical protein C8R46DRAFT_1056738 [Mycena filopes]|nr:hypothetical protein C8R46DRAFT_1056738 [Mycena filopes]
MHRALKIPEVLQLVLLEICPEPTEDPSKEETCALATLARTCRILSDPSLDALWSFQNTYVNILRCMPADLWSETWTLRRPILRSDWDGPLRYVHRVRNLCCRKGTLPANGDHAAIFEILRVALPTAHLFPHLRRLQWLFYPTGPLSLAPLLFAPTLTTLVLGNFETMFQLSMLPSVAGKCPMLTHIEISCWSFPETEFSQAISSFVCGLSRIVSLHAPSLNNAALAHLMTLRHLQTLILEDPTIEAPVDGRDPPSPPAAAFAGLRHLTLEVATPQCILAFISAVSHSPLQSLTLRDISAPDASTMRQLFSALQRHLPRSLLTRLSITSDETLGPLRTTIDALRLLFHFKNLTHVELRPPTGIDISDDDVLSLAQAWPRLGRLTLRQQLSKAPPPTATLRSLLHLAEQCSNLAQLELSLDASAVPPIARSTHGARLYHHALTSWIVGPSSISAPLQVARFLSAIFPALTSISVDSEDYGDDGDDDEDAQMWYEVQAALPICHEMREEERFWVERQAADSRAVEL